MKNIEDNINYKFNNGVLLDYALTHTSYQNYKYKNQFERLEFLGDRVLGLAMSEILYHKFGKENEGDLAKRLSVLVSGKILLSISKKLKIDKFIKVGPNINFDKNRNKSILSDAMEALIGAVFLDSSYASVKPFIYEIWQDYIINYKTPPKDNKSILQEWALANNYGIPIYSDYKKKGQDHIPVFQVKLNVSKIPTITGSGSSKKAAEMNAAKKAIDIVNKEYKNDD